MLNSINFKVGDIVKVHTKIKEGEKTRTQIFEGQVLQIRGRGENKSYTVQKHVGDVAVERIWHVGNPNVDKVDFKAKPKMNIRRAKLNFLKSPRLNP
ncbi:MAG: 50S ribosomal protein L19 [Candidatus Levybacteria bacterium]|nr:50S ribosomal protein L19 [Candidatus Levybacteria bacterium]